MSHNVRSDRSSLIKNMGMKIVVVASDYCMRIKRIALSIDWELKMKN